MAATMHAKINRKKLDKLNIIKICEEILNPSVPMALRLSGILMDDVNRFLVEINQAWKVKSVPDPTLLPKGKSQAKFEAVTLPDNNQDAEIGEIEQSLNYTNTMMGFQETAYVAMRLDNVDEPYINNDPREEAQSEQYHQADAANITLFDRFDSYRTDAHRYSRFERFDIEGDDDETQANFTSQERTQIPSSLIPSPPLPSEPQKRKQQNDVSTTYKTESGKMHHIGSLTADEILEQHPEDQVYHQPDEGKAASQPQQDLQRQGPTRRKARKPAAFAMDYEQTIIPGHIYQSWLQSASDIVSRRGRKRKCFNAMSTMKIGNLMDLPPTVLLCGLFTTGNREVHYPAPLLELWVRSTQPPHDSPSWKTSPPQPPEPSASSPADRVHYNDSMGFVSHSINLLLQCFQNKHSTIDNKFLLLKPYEDVHGGLGSNSLGVSIEKQRTNVNVNEIRTEVLMEELRNNLVKDGVRVHDANVMVTPGNSGDEVRSIPSSGSGHGTSGRSNKKRPYSSSRHSGSSLETVAEENPWQHPDPNFKLARLSENGLTPENDLLVETGPTQTQRPILNPAIDQITNSIRINAFCAVLASRDFVRVEQHVPYGDILISRGAKM
ncbi:hypothetical protein RHSIM_Rhsim09G0179600 [Rhododendron simsii]|uniref:Rad21/Rec8-like protein N-terminal domain-containing protein n=1 Tax=Rhododendron simsii TaxID=118357 RepID=A0A834GFF0_RHOSS|nr:hypothetical protein RHSIM_Rhsim09G0179600 [Rhododendron simsii]